MIIVLKQDAPDVQVREFCHELEKKARARYKERGR